MKTGISTEKIYLELRILKKRVEIIQDKKFSECLEEISFNKARKLLRRGYQFLKKEADEGRLPAMIEEDDKGRKRFKFKYADLIAWQANRKKETSLYYAGVQLYDPKFGKNFVKNFHKTNSKTTKQIKEAAL